MANYFRKVLDQQVWRQVAAAPNAHAAAACLCADKRSDISRNPFAYQLINATTLNRFNIVTKSWNFVQSPALAGTFGVGAAMEFIPSFGLVGTIAAGATPTSVTLSTALPSAVGVNMLANRGGSGDYGFKLRIIDNAAGGSGKTEERFIVGNAAGTTPLISIDADHPFTFSAANGSRYEILAGRVYMQSASTIAAGIVKTLEVATNTLANVGTTGLPTIGTDSAVLVLDEQYTPYDCNPGEGMIRGAFLYDSGIVDRYALTSTGIANGSITGEVATGDYVVAANEFRNFQIRIVQDLTNPTAVGQRRIIASHTGGASPVYTLGTNWSVNPSVGAKYVIELPNLLLLRTAGNTTVYTLNYTDATINNGTNSIASGAWSTTYFGVAPGNNAVGGQWAPSFGIRPDPDRNARHSHCHFFRGGAVTVDTLDIAAAITGTWTGAITIDGAVALTTGTGGTYSPFGNEGRMHYMNIYTASAVNQMFRFDVKNRVLSPFTPTDQPQAGTAAAGNRMAAYCAIREDENYDCVLLLSHLSTIAQELVPLV